MPDIPREYQEESVTEFFNFLANKSGHPLIGLPTGTGKSLVIAEIIRRALYWEPHRRVMALTHDKKLIEQNVAKLRHQWPGAPVGIYSAGLRSRDMAQPIIFGGIKSVANAITAGKSFGFVDLLLIDEAHLISTDANTDYRFVIDELMKVNPTLRVGGLTATPFRMKQGYLHEGEDRLFTDMAYDLTNTDGFNKLLAQGFICPLVARHTDTFVDTSQVKVTAGEFNEKQLEVVTDKVTDAIVRETIAKAAGRNTLLYFAAGIDNAEHVSAAFATYGIEAPAVHSKLKDKVNDERINAYKAGDLKAIVNNGMLTTGFDHPPIDVIAFGRATMAPNLWVQMAGRGTRIWPGKWNCMGLDFARNRERLGPINDPRIPNRKKKGAGDMPVKVCPDCQAYNHASARFCELCGHEFQFDVKLFSQVTGIEFIRNDHTKLERFTVSKVFYTRHIKLTNGIQTTPPTMRVNYICGLKQFSQFVCFEHQGLARHKAGEWWKQRMSDDVPVTVHDALQKMSMFRQPATILVDTSKDYPEIISVEF